MVEWVKQGGSGERRVSALQKPAQDETFYRSYKSPPNYFANVLEPDQVGAAETRRIHTNICSQLAENISIHQLSSLTSSFLGQWGRTYIK